MCGRSRCSLAPERVEQATGVPRERWVDRDRYHPSHNISPGAWTPILRLDEQQAPVLQTMRWGLVPSFIKPGAQLDFFKMFNARSESVAEKMSFSRLLPSQRCVVLLEGFYEWKTDAGGKKQPYYISLGGNKVIRMAGLYDVYTGGEGGPLATYTIMTVDSSPRLSWLHDRMPVVLEDDAAVQAWLNGKAGAPRVAPLHLCVPCNSPSITWHPVTPAMSKPDYQKPDASTDMRSKKGAITSFFKPSGTSPAEPKAAAAAAVGSSPAVPKQEGKQRLEGVVRNTDEEQGPTAADEQAAVAAAAAAAAGCGSGQKRARPDAAAAAADAPTGSLDSPVKKQRAA